MKKLFLIIATLIFIYFYKQTPSEPYVFSGVAMTVPYRILVGHEMNSFEMGEVEKKIQAIFERTHRIYNKWNPESELSQFNQIEIGQSVKLSPKLLHLMQETDRMWELTEGRFDPTIEGKTIGWKQIRLYQDKLTKNGDVQVDLGGIAKGQTIDELIEELGYENLLVEWGGDFRASGQHPKGRPWIVSIKNPFGGEVAQVPLINEALATSGDYEQFELKEGKHLSHIINPFTGEKLERKAGSIVSCSVLAKNCMEADALATATMLFEKGDLLNKWTKEKSDYSFYFVFFEE